MRLSDVLDCEVKTESGERLGRVFDVRAEERGGRWVVIGLCVGRAGFLERIGWGGAVGGHARKRRKDVIPWDAVVRAGRRGVVVKDGTEPE